MSSATYAGMGVARRLCRHWALVIVGALFLLLGALALDDYRPYWDMPAQRAIGNASLDYLAGDGERAFGQLVDTPSRYYGAVFEAPLVLVERTLGLEDSRDVHLSRHFLTHLFYLVGGGVCYLLVYRVFGSRTLALAGMVLFLLHPRIYAHSFFNSKDVPFLAAFMISLYLAHRAFRRETLGAYLLCGVGIGLLVNLRVMGIMLFAAVLVPRALDAAFSISSKHKEGGVRSWRATAGTAGAFALAAILTYYASLPVLWTDPVGRFAELVETLGSHPLMAYNLFRGAELYSPDGPPFDYVPVWVGITTPPAVLLLALTGAVAVAWRGLRRPRDMLRNGPLRFGMALVALPAATAVAAVVLENNIYTAWRQLYFLYAPLPLLAVFGLHWLSRGRWMRTGAYALAGVAIAVAVVSLVRIHPQEANYFNVLTDRTTPERLASRYWMGGQARGYVNSIVGDYPSGRLFIALPNRQAVSTMLPPDERGRFVFTNGFRSGERNFFEVPFDLGEPGPCPASAPPARYVNRLYAVTTRCVVDPVAYFGGLWREALATVPLDRSHFDAYRVDDVMVYVRDGCSPEDMDLRFFLRVHPVAAADLPERLRELPGRRGAYAYGFEKRDFAFAEYGASIDGNCVAVRGLPAYPIARIETGQYTPDWAVAARRAVADVAPVARSHFDVWLDADARTLTYVREACAAEDIDARFSLHVYPTDADDLPPWSVEHGFDNLDFDWHEYGMRTEDGACVAVAPLPAYPIAHVHTGQFLRGDGGTGTAWSARFAFSPPEADAVPLTGEPLVRAVFDVHRHGGALVYVKDGCTEADAEAAFALHLYPVDAADLPAAASREYGFENRDFHLWERGSRTDGRCVAVVPLPAYPIARVRTGQYDGTRELWTAEFALAE